MRRLGNINLEAIGAFVFLIMCVIVGAFVLMIVNTFNDAWNENTAVDAQSKEAISSYAVRTNNILDAAFIFYLAILWIGTLVSSYFLDNSPIFFVIFLIISILSFFIILPLANIIMAMSDGPLSAYIALMPMTYFIIEHAAIFITVFIITTGFALYAKYQGGGGVGY